ncbi:MAG: polysaccharide pyruvyl transferase family protein [Eubacterium sp.]
MEKFDRFRKDYLNLTVPCSCAEDIKNNVPINTFVVGSDIVWNPDRAVKNPNCFFGKDLTEFKTISYAASISTDDEDILLHLKDVYRANLKYMDIISVREESSIDFIQSLTDKKVYQCCDSAFSQ